MASWPWDKVVIMQDDYGWELGPKNRRTAFEDGVAREEKIGTKPVKTRSFQIRVKQSNLAEVRTWLETNGDDEFEFRDFEDETVRGCHLVGGERSVAWAVGQGLLDDELFWQADVLLESFPSA